MNGAKCKPRMKTFQWELKQQTCRQRLWDWLINCNVCCFLHTGTESRIKPAPMSTKESGGKGKQFFQLLLPCLEGDRSRNSNSVKTAKYTWLNFLPLAMLLQFRRYSNIFYLGILVLGLVGHFIPHVFLVSYHPWGTLSVLTGVCLITLTMEAKDDIQRHQADRKMDKQPVSVLEPHIHNFQQTALGKLYPGQVVRVHKSEIVPADLLLVRTSNQTQTCYVETSGIDGETDLKTRFVGKDMQHVMARRHNIAYLSGRLTYETPNSLMQFQGHFEPLDNAFITDSHTDGAGALDMSIGTVDLGNQIGVQRVSLEFQNLLLRGSTLRHTDYIDGIVLYTGHDTKIVMSSTQPPSKSSVLERDVNSLLGFTMIVYVALIVIVDSVFMYVHSNFGNIWYLRYDRLGEAGEFMIPYWLAYGFTFCGLFSVIVPLNLYVCLELAFSFQTHFLRTDGNMSRGQDKPVRVNTSNLVTELGCVTHLLCDKTGTLTCNSMRLVGLLTGSGAWHNCGKATFASSKPFECLTRDLSSPEEVQELEVPILVLALCHSVQRAAGEGGKYFGSSSDELALVDAAGKLGIQFEGSDGQGTLEVRQFGKVRRFRVVGSHPFESSRKRMSIVVQEITENTSEKHGTWLLSKGAVRVMLERAASVSSEYAPLAVPLQAAEQYASEVAGAGLRTLALGYRRLDDEVLDEWSVGMTKASQCTGLTREYELEKAAFLVEQNLAIVGVAAILDELQDGVADSLQAFRNNNVRTFMLTGDKKETAFSVSVSAGLVNEGNEKYCLDDANPMQIESVLDDAIDDIYLKMHSPGQLHGSEYHGWIPEDLRFAPRASGDDEPSKRNLLSEDVIADRISTTSPRLFKVFQKDEVQHASTLVVTGQSLEHILVEQKGSLRLQRKFVAVLSKCGATVACELSPRQKALLVVAIRTTPQVFTGIPDPVVLAVGDGSNDVPMLQEANVGVGIFGREGNQAVNNADFGIARFEYLKTLVFEHGCGVHVRDRTMTRYIVYSWHVLAFQVLFYLWSTSMSGQSTFYSPYYVTLYAWICNSVCLVIAVCDHTKFHLHLARSSSMTLGKFVVLSIRALIDAVVVTGAARFYMPLTVTLEEYSSGVYTMVVLVMTIRQLMLCHSFSWYVLGATVLALAFFLGMVTLVDDLATQAKLLWVTQSPKGWLPGIWAMVVVSLIEFCFRLV